MGRRDALKRLGKRLLGLGPADGGRGPIEPVAASLVPVAPPPPMKPGADLAELADLWVVRAALEPKGRPLLVNHWATWCDGCVEELPLLVALHQRIGDRVDFVGVGWELFSTAEAPGGALRLVDAVARDHGIRWRTLVFTGEPHELFSGLELEHEVIPQTSLLDPDGSVLFHHVGPLDSADIATLESHLAADS